MAKRASKVEYRVHDLDGLGDQCKVEKFRDGVKVISSLLCYTREEAEKMAAELNRSCR